MTVYILVVPISSKLEIIILQRALYKFLYVYTKELFGGLFLEVDILSYNICTFPTVAVIL